MKFWKLVLNDAALYPAFCQAANAVFQSSGDTYPSCPATELNCEAILLTLLVLDELEPPELPEPLEVLYAPPKSLMISPVCWLIKRVLPPAVTTCVLTAEVELIAG